MVAGSTARGFRADAPGERTFLAPEAARGRAKSRARKETLYGEKRPEAAVYGKLKQEARQRRRASRSHQERVPASVVVRLCDGDRDPNHGRTDHRAL